MKFLKRYSLIALIAVCGFLLIYRISTVRENEIAWDILGYYLYLPATFVHHDSMLNNIDWLKQINEQRHLAGTLYMVSQNESGEPMYFFLMGMSLFYLPFFFCGWLFAGTFGYATDGFSPPFQYALVTGGILYTMIGFFFLRKVLLRFFSEKITALLLLLTLFATNAVHHLTLDNMSQVNIIFMLTVIVLWNTIKWHENHKGKHLMVLGIATTLAVLVKPTEVFIILIPLFWNVTSWQVVKQKLQWMRGNLKWLFITAVICGLLVLPQMLYWHHKTGSFIYDSYRNPGVGLDFLSPHIIDVLFSYRKGWIVYTPVMIFALAGLYILYCKNRAVFAGIAPYFAAIFLITASWTEWWYGAAFSTRPLISTYPALAIGLGYFIQMIARKKLPLKILFGSVLVLFTFLNQFQWWQLKNFILEPYRTTKAYYWKTFLRTSVSEKDKELLLVYRDFSGSMECRDLYNYQETGLIDMDFDSDDPKGNTIEDSNCFQRIQPGDEFFPILELPYQELTRQDHVWLRVRMNVRFTTECPSGLPRIVNTIERKGLCYGYYASDIVCNDSLRNRWHKVEVWYLTPEIRSGSDRMKTYLWNSGKCTFDVDDVKIKVYRKR